MKILLSLSLLLICLYSKEYKVGFAQDTLANDWRLAQVNQVKEEIAKYPFLKLTVKDAKTSVSNQIGDIEYFINNNYDFIITSPINADITSLVLNKALKKGIKVILLSRGITTDDYTVFIRPDNYLIAQQAAQYMVNNLKGTKTILMLQGISGATPTIQRTKGFEEIIEQYPNLTIIKRRANYLRADAIKVMDKIYKNNIKFDAIFSQSDSMLSGVRDVMNNHNKNKKILMVGIDYIKEAQLAILQGYQSASFIYPTSAKEGVESIIDIINHKPVKKDIIIKSSIVTQDNVNFLYPIF